MLYNSQKHHRRSIRLHGYDYAQAGVYFVTVCVKDRACLLGKVQDQQMHLNDFGIITAACWQAIPDHFPHATLDTFVVMPNHIHAIIVLTSPSDANNAPNDHNVGAQHVAPLPDTAPAPLGVIVRACKAAATKHINRQHNTPGIIIWQRNYHEHIVRNDARLTHIRAYIINNPQSWDADRLNLAT